MPNPFTPHFVSDPRSDGKRSASGAAAPRREAAGRAFDQALLVALKEGHRELVRFAIDHTGSSQTGRQLVCEFFREAMSSLQAGGGMPEPKSWLVGSMRRVLSAYRASDPLGDHPADVQPVPRFLDETERIVTSCLYRILPALPSDSSWLIWQVDLLGLPPDRVAMKIGISTDRMAMRLAGARRAIYEVMKRFSTDCPTHGFLNCTCDG